MIHDRPRPLKSLAIAPAARAPMNFTEAQITALLAAWLWPLVRVAALLSSAPVIGTRAVPARIRVLLAVCVTAVLVPVLPPAPVIEPVSAAGALVTMQQVMIGLVMGLSLRLIFTVVEFAGQVLGQQMGLGFAAMVDPQSGAQVPVVGQFYVMLATLLFLSVNGHLLALHALAESFHTLPVGVTGVSQQGLGALLRWGGELFLQATVIALPTITALLIVNLGYGVLSRTAPQLHIFAVGIPITVIAGAVLMGITLPALPDHVQALMELAFAAARQILAGG